MTSMRKQRPSFDQRSPAILATFSAAGYKVRVHWSLVLATCTIAIAVATVALPDRHAGLSEATCWLLAGLASALYVISLLTHELAHCLVARHVGLSTESITLLAFDGVSKIERPVSPSQEFAMSLAGPVANLGLAGVFLLCSLPAREPTSSVMVGLGAVNLLLALFNLLPGFPLDGGRVLRSLLWAKSQDYLLASERLSRVAGVVFVLGLTVCTVLTPVNIVLALTVGATAYVIRISSIAEHRKLLDASRSS